ncbi:MAG: RNB domain-containing ribonuclease [Treponema sp.]|nr:RNB domain-containing ribonuclease [Treponema sp.]
MKKPALNSLVWYKGHPALVTELDEKIIINAVMGKTTEIIKVREKDIELVHPGPVKDLTGLIVQSASLQSEGLRDAWELIESGGVPVTLKELAELVYGDFTPQSAWAARLLLADELYFTGTVDAISAKSASEISAAEEKRQSKEKEGHDREAFLERLRSGTVDAKEDGRFLQDVEALACGKTDKSRTMKELGRTETPAEAHRLLLECGFWNKYINPYPRRYGSSFHSGIVFGTSEAALAEPPSFLLTRRDLTHLQAFAIDSPWSNDPDDAISLEIINGRRILYVHVADPASEITNGSPVDLFARERGTTLYLPESTRLMLSEEILSRFVLGIKGTADRALTFKIHLDENSTIEEAEIFPSILNVTRLSYEEADKLIDESLVELMKLAEANLERRLNAGGVNIALPEVHISVKNNNVAIQPIVPWQSADMVRECMLLAGEGAALWASRRQLPFPYITQETGDLPAKPLPGFAGSCQLRRCMRPRSVSAKPGYHWGLGLDGYSQVTSPLRRYTDLLAHQQIYACLYKEAGVSGIKPLNEENLLFSLAAGDAAAQAAIQTERASRSHWIAVYLDELLASKTGAELIWDAVVTEKRANGAGIIIPGLGLETQCGGSFNLNDTIKVRLKSVRIPELEMNFVSV